MKHKLTLKTINAADVKPKRYVIWDTDVKGFGVRVNADGSKTYVLKYVFEGQQRWYTIGKHGSPFTPDTARTEALKLLGQSKTEIDPVASRKAERHAGIIVADLCDTYLAAVKAGRVLTKSNRPKKASTVATDHGRIERHIKPLLGKRRVREVTKEDIRHFLHDVADGKTAADVTTGKPRGRAIVVGGQGTATRTVGLLGGIFGFAVQEGMRADNPVRGVKRFADNEAERFLSLDEFERLGATLSLAETEWLRYEEARVAWDRAGKQGSPPKRNRSAENPFALAAIRMLVLTGCRKSEVLEMRWDWVDLVNGYLRLPDSKTGKKAVPLSAPAVQILEALPRLSSNHHVFVGQKDGAHLVGLGKIWERIRLAAKLPGVRLHDLRHSFASVGAAGGDSLLMIGALLGHRDTKTTKRYAHLGNDPVRRVADRISGVIAEAMKQPAREGEPAKVTK
jgi:integrase